MRVEQEGGIAVFNFTVEGNHNYFILAKEYEFGQTCVLVHNAQGYVDLTDFRKTHILNRHKYGAGKLGKTEFPQSWSDQRILDAVSDVATHPKSIKGIGRFGEDTFEGVRGGILIHVDMFPANSPHYGKISTAYPIYQ